MGKDHLGDRIGSVRRHVRHGDPALPCGLGVDDIVPRGQHADVLQFGELVDLLASQSDFVGQDDLSAPSAVDDLRRIGSVMDGAISKGLQFAPTQVARVERVSVEHDDSHGCLRLFERRVCACTHAYCRNAFCVRASTHPTLAGPVDCFA